MTSSLSCGQFFVIGFPGVEASAAVLDFIAEEQIGGVILFADNCSDPERLQQQIERLQNLNHADTPMLVAIDQEGGRVCRLTGNAAEFGAAAEYGRDGGLDVFTEDYVRAARFMVGLGINLNLAPVADLDLNQDNSCMAGRCYGSDPEQVAAFVSQAVRTANQAGLLCCLKHFPGLGGAAIDPHQGVAVVDYDEIVWRSREAVPFEAGIKAGADLVMTTHLRLPKVDDRIATGSELIVEKWLRGTLGFSGAVITDCCLMKGADVLGTPGERMLAAFECGHDLLLFGQDFESARQAFYEFKAAYERGEIDPERIDQAVKRGRRLRDKLKTTSSHHAT